jgi:hypothetical protein
MLAVTKLQQRFGAHRRPRDQGRALVPQRLRLGTHGEGDVQRVARPAQGPQRSRALEHEHRAFTAAAGTARQLRVDERQRSIGEPTLGVDARKRRGRDVAGHGEAIRRRRLDRHLGVGLCLEQPASAYVTHGSPGQRRAESDRERSPRALPRFDAGKRFRHAVVVLGEVQGHHCRHQRSPRRDRAAVCIRVTERPPGEPGDLARRPVCVHRRHREQGERQARLQAILPGLGHERERRRNGRCERLPRPPPSRLSAYRGDPEVELGMPGGQADTRIVEHPG